MITASSRGGTADWGTAVASALAEIEVLDPGWRPAGDEPSAESSQHASPRHGGERRKEQPALQPAAVFCVMDGHCGREAAEQALEFLPDELARRVPAWQQALKQVGTSESLSTKSDPRAHVAQKGLDPPCHGPAEPPCVHVAIKCS